MMRIQKGEPGYIKAQKRKFLVGTAAEFAVVIGLVVLGYVQTGSRLNLLTVVAVVGCLPAAKMLVELITLWPHQGIGTDVYKEVEEKAPLLMKAYDLVITGSGKAMQVDVFVISDHTVYGYTDSQKTDEAKLSSYLKEMLKNNRVEKVTVKIFHDYTAFLARAEGMNNIMTVDRSSDGKRENKIRRLLLTVSI